MYLHGHADVGAVEEDVLVAPGGQPGGLVGAARAQAADSFQGRHNAVDERGHHRAPPVWSC